MSTFTPISEIYRAELKKAARCDFMSIMSELSLCYPEDKDIERIRNLIIKSKGDESKMLALCKQMAATIKDPMKAIRRGEAAYRLLPESIRVAGCEFFQAGKF